MVIFAVVLSDRPRYIWVEHGQRFWSQSCVARTCTICHHRRRDGIDKLLLSGEQPKSVARRYSVSEDAVGRHKKHMQLVIAKAAAVVEQKDLAYGSALLAEIGRIRADAEHLQIESVKTGNIFGGSEWESNVWGVLKTSKLLNFISLK